jgi:hypothetical protein
MLSFNSLANAAVPAAPAPVGSLASATTLSRVRPGVGASFRRCGPTWLREDALLADQGTLLAGQGIALAGQGIALADRQAKGEAALLGNGTHAAGLAKFARQQRTSNKYAHSTKMYARPTIRTATTSGGARGPHPARDPV